METTAIRTARNWGLGLLVAFNLLDVLTTYIALHHGALEANPVARSIIGHGFGWVIFWKAVWIGVFALVAIRLAKPLPASLAIWTAVGAYLMVVMINVSTLQHLAA